MTLSMQNSYKPMKNWESTGSSSLAKTLIVDRELKWPKIWEMLSESLVITPRYDQGELILFKNTYTTLS